MKSVSYTHLDVYKRQSLKRAHIMASVGVCTRPMELLAEPEAIANARLAFMPTLSLIHIWIRIVSLAVVAFIVFSYRCV